MWFNFTSLVIGVVDDKRTGITFNETQTGAIQLCKYLNPHKTCQRVQFLIYLLSVNFMQNQIEQVH